MNARIEPTAEQQGYDKGIERKLLWTPPKQDKEGNDIEGSARLEKCGENARRILENDRRICNRLGYDEARRSCVIRKELPWSVRRGVDLSELEALYDPVPWDILGENDITEISAFLMTHYRLTISTPELRRWIDLACNGFRFHSIRLWLDSLEWDGKPRIDDWLIRLALADDTPLNRAYCPRILQAAVARAYVPGCKVDTMPILTSSEGKGKSSLWQELAGCIGERRLHCVFAENITSKDGTRVLHSAWIVDLDECTSLKMSPHAAKQWITSSEDKIVQKFKNEAESWPRSSILVSSTNPDAVIKDPAGARRYWVIGVGTVNRKGIVAEREQLWAEAVHRYRRWVVADSVDSDEAAELHWSLPARYWPIQAESVQGVLEELPFDGQIAEYLNSTARRTIKTISTREIISSCIMGGLPGIPPRTAAKDVAETMYRLGWARVKYKDKEGNTIRGWERPPVAPTPTRATDVPPE